MSCWIVISEDKEITAHLVARRKLQVHILADGRGRTIGTGLIALLLAKLGPHLALRDGMWHCSLLKDALCLPGDLIKCE